MQCRRSSVELAVVSKKWIPIKEIKYLSHFDFMKGSLNWSWHEWKRNLFFLAMLTDLQQHLYIKSGLALFQTLTLFCVLCFIYLHVTCKSSTALEICQLYLIFWTITCSVCQCILDIYQFYRSVSKPRCITLKACMWGGEWWFITELILEMYEIIIISFVCFEWLVALWSIAMKYACVLYLFWCN